MTGRIIKSTGSWYDVLNEAGEIIPCRIKGKFRIKGIKSTNPVAVGDVVQFSMENETNGLIEDIQDRKNYIIRRSVNLSKQVHIIASNIDQALLVVSLKSPPTPIGFIDRFLVSAEAYDIPTLIIFNKIDLLSEEDHQELEELERIYRKAGYSTLRTSAKQNLNIDKLQTAISSQTSLLSGHSGVGKSTLINLCEPGLELKTQEVSDFHSKGQHTTTFAEMYPLQNGGFIIDTPGIKGFGLVDMDRAEIQDYFPDIFELKGQCKFHNCLHEKEPGCAVKKAVEEGELSESRYNNYINLINDDEDNSPYRKDIYG
ncbi:MAG: ribosome small subunit-dependent GTPase A [Schleiferiaceae bacterium]|jgi:ribosome biogenesis GTPase|nr:ribosome small subunit-dependent GTPase A [Schleiferiaceae bacterium]